ncbi:MAG: phosphatase PAP2 family protein [Pseudomonadota bacterium]
MFSVCYLLANALALRQGVTRELVFPFEAAIPFLPAMVIPYLSSGLLFFLAFRYAASADALRLLSQRTLLATVLASFVFVLYPLHFAWQRPPVDSPLLGALFDMLAVADKPYNQLPSLHVAYCVIFWPPLSGALAWRGARVALAAWLLMTASATVFTFQHHAADVLGGLLLGLACVALLRPGRREPHVAFYYLMAASVAIVVGVLGARAMVLRYLALYLALSLALVGAAYWRGQCHFLRKRAGRHGALAWLLYAPYLLGYRLTWLAVLWRERRSSAFVEFMPGLLVGRRLRAGEARALPLDCAIIDLAGELSETPLLRTGRYRHVALLDLVTPPQAAMTAVFAAIDAELAAGRSVYLHCAMGYSRCILLANSYKTHAER